MFAGSNVLICAIWPLFAAILVETAFGAVVAVVPVVVVVVVVEALVVVVVLPAFFAAWLAPCVSPFVAVEALPVVFTAALPVVLGASALTDGPFGAVAAAPFVPDLPCAASPVVLIVIAAVAAKNHPNRFI